MTEKLRPDSAPQRRAQEASDICAGRPGSAPNTTHRSLRSRWQRARLILRLSNSQVLRLRAEHGCIAHEQYLEKLRRGVKAVQLGDELGFRRSLAAETRRQTDVLSKGTAILEVTSANELASTPMWLQGDVSWSSEENTRKRQQLRQDGPVRELLQKFWEAAQRSLQQASGCDHSDSLHYEGYAQLFRRVYRLVIEEYDDEDVEASISEDWLNDTRGLSSLHRESFCDAVFQVADMCETASRSIPSRLALTATAYRIAARAHYLAGGQRESPRWSTASSCHASLTRSLL